ncbi:MAG: LPS export ABC transporter periplasmic protein LptC [Candidatus Delongbacteria bacterium]|nr:LPS export ABC transporter periplasmic protein LptC [Candidatus Delongbacteria bacterium]
MKQYRQNRSRQRKNPLCRWTNPVYGGSLALPLLFVLFAAWGQNGCSNLDATSVDSTAWEMPAQQLYNTRMRFYDLYGLQGELTAPQVDQYLRRDLYVMPVGFSMVTWDSLGNENATIEADSGSLNERRRNIRAVGNVVVTSQQGLKLETGILEWDNFRRRIFTEDSVCFTTTNDTLFGIGFVSNRDLSNWEIGTPTGRSYRQLEEKPHE